MAVTFSEAGAGGLFPSVNTTSNSLPGAYRSRRAGEHPGGMSGRQVAVGGRAEPCRAGASPEHPCSRRSPRAWGWSQGKEKGKGNFLSFPHPLYELGEVRPTGPADTPPASPPTHTFPILSGEGKQDNLDPTQHPTTPHPPRVPGAPRWRCWWCFAPPRGTDALPSRRCRRGSAGHGCRPPWGWLRAPQRGSGRRKSRGRIREDPGRSSFYRSPKGTSSRTSASSLPPSFPPSSPNSLPSLPLRDESRAKSLRASSECCQGRSDSWHVAG